MKRKASVALALGMSFIALFAAVPTASAAQCTLLFAIDMLQCTYIDGFLQQMACGFDAELEFVGCLRRSIMS
ncbi:MAG TPA: hypothetical protein VNC59_02885 [Thermoanaerobaculia bacterium]|nr:hypothetical protein [Thermoanaerobaculia bacterium]